MTRDSGRFTIGSRIIGMMRAPKYQVRITRTGYDTLLVKMDRKNTASWKRGNQFIFPLRAANDRSDHSGFRIVVLSEQGIVVSDISQQQIEAIEWQTQTYYLKADHSLKEKKLDRGSVDFYLDDSLLYSATIFPFGSSARQPFPIILQGTSNIVNEKNFFYVIFGGETPVKARVLSNITVKNYLQANALLK